jgi:hypothetical protein
VNVCGDEVPVISLIQKREASLSKKQNSIAYHKTRETVPSGMIRVANVNTFLNLADALTKSLPKAKRDALIDLFMY